MSYVDQKERVLSGLARIDSMASYGSLRHVAKDLLKTMDNSTVMQEALGEAQEALQHTCHSP